MKKLVRDGIEQLVPYPPGKPIEELERELGITGSIKLASNENPLGPSPKAMEAIKEKLSTLNRYPDGSGYYLKSSLSEKFDLPVDQIILGNGSNEIIELTIRTFLNPGEEALQPFPTFLVYEKIVRAAGGKMISVPLKDFNIDLNSMKRAIGPHTKVVFIANPNNPTGAALSQKDLMAFLQDIPEHLIVVLDEAYIEFVTDPEVANGLNLLEHHPHLVVLRTFSKLYGLAGLRIGYGFSSKKIINYMNRVRQPFNVNSLAQTAALAALDDEAFVQRTLELVRDGLKQLATGLKQMGISFMPTHTNFLLIKAPLGGKATYERMLREGVIIRAMDSFGLPDHIRITVGLPEENIRFLKAFQKILEEEAHA
ncbi:MAG: histidinol-phosphate transaminase [Deltaproteobacteria bacterium]|nr:histidinol-phosphate transaminase [Deltaproteobacteria bacterium]MBW1928568.1 histidinol-phosphate transaminase [Deltaproteobacteria bacterium]MBW2025308.1 histidinol-phosphate transaminase [Deltaproteobacteria bacterium]